MSIPSKADAVTGLDLLATAAGYGTIAGLMQFVSHKIFAREPLPKTWQELITRYTAGSAIVGLNIGAFAILNPKVTSRDTAALLILVYLASGLVAAGCHYADDRIAEAARSEGEIIGAEKVRRHYEDRENGRISTFERLHGRTRA